MVEGWRRLSSIDIAPRNRRTGPLTGPRKTKKRRGGWGNGGLVAGKSRSAFGTISWWQCPDRCYPVESVKIYPDEGPPTSCTSAYPGRAAQISILEKPCPSLMASYGWDGKGRDSKGLVGPKRLEALPVG